MEKMITAREANQKFAKVLRAVEGGADFVVTRNGVPVARITSATPAARVLSSVQEEALARTMNTLRQGWALGGEAPERDRLHDR